MCEFNIKRVKFHNLSNKKKIYYNAIIQCRYQFIKLGRKDMNILLIRKVAMYSAFVHYYYHDCQPSWIIIVGVSP